MLTFSPFLGPRLCQASQNCREILTSLRDKVMLALAKVQGLIIKENN